MKKTILLFLTLTGCLLVSQATTHAFRFFNSNNNILSITDQSGTVYSDYTQVYNIEEGTTITFTLKDNSDCKSVAIYNKDITQNQLMEYNTTYTVTSSTPSTVWMISAPKDGDITMWSKPAAGGYVEVTDGGMVEDPSEEDAANGEYFYLFECGYDYTITAVASPGYHFAYWGDDPTNTNPTRTYHTGTYTSLDVHFEPDMVTLEDNNAASYYDAFASAHPGTVTVQLAGRTFRSGMWNTVCLPFSLTQEQTESIFGTNAVASLRSATGDYTGLDIYVSYLTTGGMVAGRPYLVLPASDIENPIFRDVTFSSFTNGSPYSTENSSIRMQGTLRPTAMQKDNKSTLCMGNNNSVYFPSVSNNIKAFRAYFVIDGTIPPSAPQRPRFIVVEDQNTTGQSAVQTEDNRPSKYMKDGKLIIENNGKQYNAQGQQL